MMRSVLGLILFLSVYVIVYYRLLVRLEYEKSKQVKESTFGALFSLPPYRSLSDKGKAYAKKYWYAVFIMIVCIAYLAITSRYTIA